MSPQHLFVGARFMVTALIAAATATGQAAYSHSSKIANSFGRGANGGRHVTPFP